MPEIPNENFETTEPPNDQTRITNGIDLPELARRIFKLLLAELEHENDRVGR
jgi:hypothetical protein